MSSIQDTTSIPATQRLIIPFTSRDKAGQITVSIQPNDDPDHGAGLDLIFPTVPQKDFSKQFHGFPVTKATVEYPVSSTSTSPSSFPGSYACYFGWIQVIKASPGGKARDVNHNGKWQMDIFPYATDLGSPFAIWGFNPTFFDAPARLLPQSSETGEVRNADEVEIEELVWRAQSFLCVLEDAGMTKRVQVIEGSGFGWGCDIEKNTDAITAAAEGQSPKLRKITISKLEHLDTGKEWNARLELLREKYPAWSFAEAQSS
jgi:hypothetical protein